MRTKNIAIKEKNNVSSSPSQSASVSKKRKQHEESAAHTSDERQQHHDTAPEHNYHFKKAKATCLKCDKSGGILLSCVVPICPVAFHKKCAPPTISDNDDEGGPFYCPYCNYTRYLSLTDQAMESVSHSYKLLSRFLATTVAPKVHPPPAPAAQDYRACKGKNYNDDIANEEGKGKRNLHNLPLCNANGTSPESSARGKRVAWSPQEEEMLKDGVCMFSSDGKSIPWRKILKFGSHIFESSRTPESLRNKWKNNLAEDCCPLTEMFG